MRVVRTRTELAVALAEAPADRAVVMTMGALHEGHLELVRRARPLAEHLVVTVFVNPLQFGPAEDLDTYPRDLQRDLDLLSGLDVDLVFAPDVEQMYPHGEPVVRVSAGPIGEVLEGAHRPGHFDGVLTVVLKMLQLVRPRIAVFGEKDAQQLIAVRRMVRDLDLDVRIIPVPTVRAADGLALSSRNVRLRPEERERALALSAALRAGAERADGGVDEVLAAARAVLAAARLDVDYLALMDPETAQAVPPDHSGPAVLAVAARVGTVRLIDNVPVDLRRPAGGAGSGETPSRAGDAQG